MDVLINKGVVDIEAVGNMAAIGDQNADMLHQINDFREERGGKFLTWLGTVGARPSF